MLQFQRLMQNRPRVAVVEMTGMIGGTLRPDPYIELFRNLKRAPWARSVLLSIDSPGGSVWASEALEGEVARLAEEKPVVAYIRGLGASGAYMIAVAAERIIALPSALVGSIGVISLHPMARDLLQRLGVEFNVTKGGHLKDMGAFYRPSTEEETEKQQSLVNEFYERFVDLVATEREMSPDQVRALATGEVFTGRRALEMGLVDEVGDLERAEEVAAELGEVSPEQTVKVHPPRHLRDLLLGSFGRSGAAADFHTFFSQPVLYLSPAYAQGAFLDLLRR